MLLTSTNVTTGQSVTEVTFAGLFILLFLVVIGGGGVLVWFISKQAVGFFKTYKDSTSKQLQETANANKDLKDYLSVLSNAQERITDTLERIEHNISSQKEEVKSISFEVKTITKTVESHQNTTEVKLSKIEEEIEKLDNTVSLLNKDVEHLSFRIENVKQNTPSKGGGEIWNRNAT